jgi:gentisate 1,2-dioxygenase
MTANPSSGLDSPIDAAEYQRAVQEAHLAPLWVFFKDWFPPEPRVEATAHLWHYDRLRPLLMESARAISTGHAERRVLALENPGLPGRRLVTDALYAGLQVLMPGEFARTHRHTASALRFIIESDASYTAVAGERAYMEPGDFIVTPSWAWHEHRNEGQRPTVWLDVLDVPLVRMLGAGFSEHYPGAEHPTRVPPEDSHYRYGSNLLPVGYRRDRGASPVFSYPYARSREVLRHLECSTEWDPYRGLMMEYIDPTTGGPAIPTISTFLQLVPQRFVTRPYRTTSSAVLAVIEGRGEITVGFGDAARRLRYGPRDLLAVPSWQPLAVAAEEESVFFSASDEAVQRKLGFWREHRES